jgi:hypothetical protein
LCDEVAAAGEFACGAASAYARAKEARPVVHFGGTVAALFVAAWLGGRVNNFFLLYLLTLAVALLPGLHKKGLLKKYFSSAILKIEEAIKGKEGLKKME